MNADQRRSGRLASACIRVHLRFAICALTLAAGCASSDKRPSTQPSNSHERQEAALDDPFGYSPNLDKDKPDISGGDIGHYDREGMKRDIDNVLNP